METCSKGPGALTYWLASFQGDHRSTLPLPGNLRCKLDFLSSHNQQTLCLSTFYFAESSLHEQAQFSEGLELPSVQCIKIQVHAWLGVLFLSELNSNHLFADSNLSTGRPWSVFSSPFHPFTPSHRFRAKWIWFSKYSFAGSVLGLLMSDGNCFCYFPKWKSTSEEQLVCCNVLLPPITSPIPPSQSKPGLDCFICEQGLWDMAGEMCWWQGNGIRELLCALLYLRETGGGRG